MAPRALLRMAAGDQFWPLNAGASGDKTAAGIKILDSIASSQVDEPRVGAELLTSLRRSSAPGPAWRSESGPNHGAPVLNAVASNFLNRVHGDPVLLEGEFQEGGDDAPTVVMGLKRRIPVLEVLRQARC